MAAMPLSDRESLTALSYLFVTFGHATDGTLGMEEMRSLAGRLTQRVPGADLTQVGELLRGAIAEYKTHASMADKFARARQCIETLRAHAGDTEVEAILEDLREIANADGRVSPEEEKFIATVAAALGSG